ncbi:MAG: tetratricopeptide repeat protein [Luteolibacter sp.]|uniref:tetratricopeptide repeat protein n=1 Tax=Luteolibacter sp. TaxID=1962973 RepID=UPI00326449EA
MKSSVSLIAFLGRACAVSLLLAVSAFAQEATLESLIGGSQAAMKEKNWEQALELNTQAVTRFGGEQPLRKYGPQFGIIFYRKGLCEMKLKRWKEAMLSFESCYRDFPNGAAARDTGNIYQKLALLKWGESAMGAEDWELALTRFAKFIEERDKIRDKFPQGSYQVNLAICHYKLGHIAQGSENLEIAIRNKANFPTPDTGIIAGFQALVSAVIEKGNEQALLDFIGKNRGGLCIEPYEMYRFSPAFMKLAGDAIGVGMRRAAMELYQFVPSTDVAIDDVRARLKAMGTASQIEDSGMTYTRTELEEDLTTFEADRRGKRATETIKLAAVAFLHEAGGNFTGAFAAYQQLEIFYPGAEKREENLFNLIRVASRAGRGAKVRKYADTFVKTFPESTRITDVRRLILSTLYEEGDSADCVAVGGPMLELLAKGTSEHDLCLFILGVSYFNSGMYDKAGELLDLHVTAYPRSEHAVEAAFYQASNAARLRLRDKSAALFDAFLAAHPSGSYVAPGLYERAACHFAANEMSPALEKIRRLTTEFPDSAVAAQAFNLQGNVELASGHPAEAEKAYLKALEIASARNDRSVVGDTLCELVELLGGNGDVGKMKAAVSHADRFWKEYAEGSPWQTRVAVAQVRPFVSAGRGDEALGRLHGIIAKGVSDPGEAALLIDSYAVAFLGKHSPEELAQQLGNFPGIDPANKSQLAHLRMAVITAFEKEARDAKEEARRLEAAAMVKTLYQKIKTDFTPKDLDTLTLIRLGDHLRLTTSTPREALVFYDEAIGRDDPALRTNALLGRADVRARSTVAAEIDLGIGDFKKVYEDSKSGWERGYALFRIVELSMAKGDFANAVEQATVYLNRDKSQSADFVPQVSLMLARSYQELKRTDEAINEYARVWSMHTEDLGISAPAMNNWMQLLWSRNRDAVDGAGPSDRQTAYKGGMKYLDRTRGSAAALKEEDLGPWREIEQAVKTFATSPGIKPTVANDGSTPTKPLQQ